MAFKQFSPLPIIEGGTNTQSFVHAFGIAYYDGGSLNNIDPGTSGQILTSNGNGGAASFQPVTAIGVVTSVTGNSGSATPSSGILTVTGDGTVLSTSGSGSTLSLTSTAIRTAATSSGTATASANSITFTGAGGISTSASGSTVTITGSGGGGGITWNDQTTTPVSMAINNAYSVNNAGLVTLTLPSTAAFGSIIQVSGYGAGGWLIAQNSGQTIHFGAVNTTTGAAGSLASTNRYDQVTLVCSVANTDWVVNSSFGNITYV